MEDLSALEGQMLMAMVRADCEQNIMEQQIAVARVVKRDYTGHGFFTKLSTPDHVPLLDRGRWKIEDMPQGFAYHPGLPSGASFILWIKDGRVVTLEGFTNDGHWPEDGAGFRVAV